MVSRLKASASRITRRRTRSWRFRPPHAASSVQNGLRGSHQRMSVSGSPAKYNQRETRSTRQPDSGTHWPQRIVSRICQKAQRPHVGHGSGLSGVSFVVFILIFDDGERELTRLQNAQQQRVAAGRLREAMSDQDALLSANQHWTRPGKSLGMFATPKDRTFCVFSSNVPQFEDGLAYRPFSVYALLEHGGDFSERARVAFTPLVSITATARSLAVPPPPHLRAYGFAPPRFG